MRRWRRFIAIFLLLAFVPSSLLAAMPLVWCVGDDGHRSVEYRISTTAKHLDHHSLGSQRDDVAKPKAADGDGCQDWQLVGKAKTAKVQEGAGVLTFDVRDTIVLPILPTTLKTTSASPCPTYSSRARVPDVQRVALRSVVLLI